MMKKLLIALALAAVLPGCASQMTPAQQASILQAQAERPTLAVTCPAGGCSVEYTDPRDRVQLPRNTGGADVVIKLIDTAGSVALGAAPWAAVANIAGQAGDRVSNSYNQATDSTHTPTVVTAPAPVVVTAPDPVIVQQPAPVMVPAGQ